MVSNKYGEGSIQRRVSVEYSSGVDLGYRKTILVRFGVLIISDCQEH